MLSAEWIPLYQTLIWVFLAIGVAFAIRRDVGRIRDALVRRIEQGASLDVGPLKFGELRAELHSVREDLRRVESAVAELFLATMSDVMFDNLRKLASGSFGSYHLGAALERELYHLRDIGYIDVYSIQQIPKHGPELSQYLKVTEAGKKFVQLRSE
jgi:hypothetical protein